MTKFSDSLRGYGHAIFQRDGFKCQYCGRDGSTNFDVWLTLSVDHLLPQKHPLRHEPEYMTTACQFCNTANNRYFDKAKKQGLSFDGVTRAELIAQRLPYVQSTREQYQVFWEKEVANKLKM